MLLTGTADEDVYLIVNGTEYKYSLDKAKHVHFFKLLKYTPGKALGYIKAESYKS